MAINKAMKLALKALSYPDIDIKKTYKWRRQIDQVVHTPKKPFYKIWDRRIPNKDYDIPVRIFLPSEEKNVSKPIIFFHGGGWVIGNIDSYSSICANMANQTGHTVISVDYRLAPEYRFPTAPEDCYTATREIFKFIGDFGMKQEDITLVGDSAGGNLASVVSLMARDRGEFLPSKQILIYPSAWNDHSTNSPFPSIQECGTDYLLTSKRMCQYMELYIEKEEDRENPYLAPLLSEDLSRQPRTLIITAEYDPLRDEGEAYGKKLMEYGNEVFVHRMEDGLHGFLSLPKHFVHVKQSYNIINHFINE